MKKVCLYTCEKCSTTFEKKASALKCEENHLSIDELFLVTHPNNYYNQKSRFPAIIMLAQKGTTEDVYAEYKLMLAHCEQTIKEP